MYKFILPVNNYKESLLKKQTRKRNLIESGVEVYVSIFLSRKKILDYGEISDKVVNLLEKAFIKSRNQIFKISVERFKKERGNKERMVIEVLESE